MSFPDFHNLFGLTVHPLELVIRGTVVYWLLYLLFRSVLRRDVGSVAIADVLLLVLIADAAQNAMSGGYESITDGVVLVGTIAAWNYALDWATCHSSRVRKLLEAQPLLLVKDGKMIKANMREELITAAELMSSLREQGIDKLEHVKRARMEPNGHLSVIKADAARGDDGPPPRAPAAGTPG
ncbi:MAG: YetF domain-containing protein [Pseudomonadota bacterium]